jgi:hypothetical protein
MKQGAGNPILAPTKPRLKWKGKQIMKAIINYFWRVLLAVLILTILFFVFNILFGTNGITTGLGWVLLSNLLIVIVLTYPILRCRAFGLSLARVIFLLFFGIYTLNTNIEAIFFQLTITRSEAVKIISQGFLVALLFAPILVMIMGKMQKPATEIAPYPKQRISIKRYVWGIAVCDISYVFLYLVAGAIIFPYVKDFYAQLTALPKMHEIILMQLFRGLIYIGVLLPIIRMMKGNRLETVLIAGLLLSVLGGIAPLLLPNPYMPAYIRTVHAFEIGISNFIFGAIIGNIFGTKTSTMISRETQAA